MTAQQLKNSILQMAVQGKLVPQDPDDEPASVLLERIKAKKQELIKAGKIKKDKPQAPITEDEIPFEIPDSWVWCRLGDLISYQNGYAYKSTDMSIGQKGYAVIKSGNLMTLEVVIKPKNDYIEKPNSKMLESLIVKGDLLMCLSSQSDNPEPLGKTAIYKFDTPALLNQRVLKITPINKIITNYLYFVINSEYFHYTVSHQGGGSAQANLKLEHVLSMLIPLAPVKEQLRIVAKIEELLPYIERYGKAEEHLTALNTTFPEALKKSILQEVVQGKLVPQNPNDEPASVLLERIKAEKQKLIKEGKIKKEKPLSPITEEEIPFDIPDNWCWCKLGDILLKLTDGTHSTPKYTESGTPFISVKDVSSGKLDFSNCKHISNKEHSELYERCNPEYGDILLTKVGTTGIPVIVDTTEQFSLFVSVALLKFNQELLYNKYLIYMINSPLVQKQATENTKGVGNKNWVMRDIANTLIVIPPIEGQHRIVEKIEELMPFIGDLAK